MALTANATGATAQLRLGDRSACHQAWRTEGGLGRGASGVAHRGRARVSVLSGSVGLLAPPSRERAERMRTLWKVGRLRRESASKFRPSSWSALKRPSWLAVGQGLGTRTMPIVWRRTTRAKVIALLWGGAESSLTPPTNDYVLLPLSFSHKRQHLRRHFRKFRQRVSRPRPRKTRSAACGEIPATLPRIREFLIIENSLLAMKHLFVR
jgi:hypothetical protein